MKILPLDYRTAIAIQVYQSKSDDDPFIGLREPMEDVEISARKLIETIEDNVCVAFLEALILESKKAINRHAAMCEGFSDDWDPPEWARKYEDVGV